MPDVDVIIIGSGPAGAHAACPLVQAGKTVAMIDGGNTAPKWTNDDASPGNFEDVRRSDPAQYRWFLGEDLSGIPVDGLTGGLGGGQVSGNRSYVVRDADALLPLVTENCQMIQSLAKGGLGSAWGATCAYLTPSELSAMGLDPAEMEQRYEIIARRIGVSGPQTRPGIQPPLRPDHHASALLSRFESKKATFDKDGIAVMQPHAAVLTQNMPYGEGTRTRNRKATSYTDMEYWADPKRSVYRPQYTIEELEQHPNFQYIGKMLVDRIHDAGSECSLLTTPIGGSGKFSLSARRVIVAAGAVGSARILLRSFGLEDTPIPFVGKPHVFSACLHPATLGQAGPRERISLCQLLVIDQRKAAHDMDAGCAQLYSYRSLQLFRLLSSVPLPAPQALSLLALLSPSLVIADIRFPALPSSGNTATLTQQDGKERIRIKMSVGAQELSRREATWKRLRCALRKLGLLPVRNMRLPEASSSHYAGTIPVVRSGETWPLATDRRGKLTRGTNIFVADASVFRCLPAKPHTLTLMANADRIGSEVAGTLG